VVQTVGLTGQGLDELEEYGILPQGIESSRISPGCAFTL